MACDRSVTGQYLSGKKFIPVPATRREGNGKWLTVKGAQQNNLKKGQRQHPAGDLYGGDRRVRLGQIFPYQ